MVASEPSPINYETLFLVQVQRAVQYALEIVQEMRRTTVNMERIGYVLHTLSFALDAPLAWHHTRDILLLLRPFMERLGRYEEWSKFLEKGLDTSHRIGDQQSEAELKYEIGMVYFVLGKGDAAQQAFEDSYNYFSEIDHSEGSARALNGFARIAHGRGQLQSAINYTYQALAVLGNTPTAEHATGYRLLGTIAFSQREWQKALTFFQQDLDIWRAEQNARHIGFGLVNIGSALRALEQYDLAIPAYQEALTLFEADVDAVHLATVQMNLGNVYLKQHQYEKARELYIAADWQLRKAQEVVRLAMLYNNLGMAYAGLAQWKQSEQFYLDSIQRWKALSNHISLVNTMDNLGEMYIERGDKESAQNVLEEAYIIALEINDEHLIQMVTKHLKMARQM